MTPQILHVIDQTGDGGAQVLIHQYTRILGEEYSFSVANLGKSGRFSGAYQALGIPVFELGSSTVRWNPFSMVALLRLIDEVQPEIVHTHLFKASILGTIAAKIKRKHVIIHDHMGVYPGSFRYYTNYFPRVIQPAYFWVYRLCLNLSDVAIVLTPEMQRSYRDFYTYKKDKVVVLPNAIECRNSRTSSNSHSPIPLREELGIADDEKIITMVGRLEPEKDWETFLRVAQKIEEACPRKSVFLAVGDGSLRKSLVEFAKLQELTNVRFLGYRNDVPEILRQSDLFLLTSKREPFGIVILEAMAAGCPVIATRSGGPESIITDGIDGMLASVGDVQGLVNHIMFLLEKDLFRRELGLKSRKLVDENYALPAIKIRMEKIYTTLLGNP
jgi:glycosyltransferase involved in cell wall biosynthesis